MSVVAASPILFTEKVNCSYWLPVLGAAVGVGNCVGDGSGKGVGVGGDDLKGTMTVDWLADKVGCDGVTTVSIGPGVGLCGSTGVGEGVGKLTGVGLAVG